MQCVMFFLFHDLHRAVSVLDLCALDGVSAASGIMRGHSWLTWAVWATWLSEVASECLSSLDVVRCQGLGPSSSLSDLVISYLVLDTSLWTPTLELLRQLWPNLMVLWKNLMTRSCSELSIGHVFFIHSTISTLDPIFEFHTFEGSEPISFSSIFHSYQLSHDLSEIENTDRSS
jgi:hypothetical protein